MSNFFNCPSEKETLYFTPDAILVIAGAEVAAFRYCDVEIVARSTRFVEEGAAPSDTQVVGETWRFVNKSGGPDRRSNNNRKLPICLYGEIDFKSSGGLNERIHCSRVDLSQVFASAFSAMREAELPIAPPLPLLQTAANTVEEGDVATAYSHETEFARSLALSHGKLWEFLWVEELLKTRFQSFEKDWGKLEASAREAPKVRFTGGEFTKWTDAQCSVELSAAIINISVCVNKRLMEALGAPGTPGDPIKILAVVNSFFESCRRFPTFEIAICAAEVPPSFERLKNSFRGITLSALHIAEDLKDQWIEKTDALKNGATSFQLKIHLETPPEIKLALKELDKIAKHPERFRDNA
jgi:hypothetical protein